MKIWFINHYAVPPQYYPLARPSLFARNLQKRGHEVTIIAASTVHNADINLITDGQSFRRETVDGIPYVYIKCASYQGNGLKRAYNIVEFAAKLNRVCDRLEKPDVIMATVFDPLTCYMGVRYAAKNRIPAVAEIADLWPETLLAYGSAKASNPIVKALRRVEKRIYTRADAIVFTMEGGYDYIREQGWSDIIPPSKVHYINNGIDLEQFDRNRSEFTVEDPDLDDEALFKVVYAGAIRRVNNLGKLLDVAKAVTNPRVRFLIWGDGEERADLQARVEQEHIQNVRFKGKVDKKYIPYITSRASLNFAHNSASPLFRFGISFNKIFDYLAAGAPVLCDFEARYNPVKEYDAGFTVETADVGDIARSIDQISRMPPERLAEYGRNARTGARAFDFSSLSDRLLSIFESIRGN